MTDRDTYLARLGRELRADLTPADEQHVTPIAEIKCGRRAIVVEVATSGQHGSSCHLRALAPEPVPGRVRNEQSGYLYLRELDALLDALAVAPRHLVAVEATRDAKRAPPSPVDRPRGAPPASLVATMAGATAATAVGS
jgi:hypothetical protein